MAARVRPYLFYDVAISICSTCYRKVEAKIVFQDDRVLLLKHCPEHGHERVLIADDVDYYRRCREVFLKPPEMPQRYNTPVKWGCPVRLRALHRPRAALVPVAGRDLRLLQPALPDLLRRERPRSPAVPHRSPRSSACSMPSSATRAKPDVVQISGGEPTMHPDFFAVLELAKARPISHLMVNTNGVRIAESEAFAERLAELHARLRGLPAVRLVRARRADRAARRRPARGAREGARAAQPPRISTTLVVTLKKGLNDDEIGRIIDFALSSPASAASRSSRCRRPGGRRIRPGTRPADADRGAAGILEQTSVFQPEDVIPVPCHPDSWRWPTRSSSAATVTPLTGLIDPDVLINAGRNTIIYEQDAGSATASSSCSPPTTRLNRASSRSSCRSD